MAVSKPTESSLLAVIENKNIELTCCGASPKTGLQDLKP
jgi:hypothetical protein